MYNSNQPTIVVGIGLIASTIPATMIHATNSSAATAATR